MNSQSLSALILDESMPVDVEWARKLQAEHPTCLVPLALLLRRNGFLLTEEEADNLRTTIMLGAPDPEAMADLADLAGRDWMHFYPQTKQEKPSTVSTIDTFLETYGHVTPQENAMLERMIFNPVAPDYFHDTEPAGPQDDWTDLMPAEKDEPRQPEAPAVKDEPNQKQTEEPQKSASHEFQPNLRLSLAKIFIKQRRYERAFEIINNLCLNNPEKSAYFADQLRFLQKLINNQRFAKGQNASADASQQHS